MPVCVNLFARESMRLLDLSGKQFGYLTVTGRSLDRRTYGGAAVTYWMARCACGHLGSYSANNLRRGRVRSCSRRDCDYAMRLRVPRYAEHSETAGLRQIVGWYKARSKRKGIKFSLLPADVAAIIGKPCHYCGAEPGNVARNDSRYGRILYSGIDRIDSSQGYSPENIVPCCRTCNTMKSAMSATDFLAHVQRIASRL